MCLVPLPPLPVSSSTRRGGIRFLWETLKTKAFRTRFRKDEHIEYIYW